MHKIAMIADPHYHEIFPGYDFAGVTFDGKLGACIRTRADSSASTRIFNESYFAFRAALDACADQDIRLVAIVGDLTDDGQIASMNAALGLLDQYEREHGMRFFLTPGNHDIYGMSGRHHAKRFYERHGGTALVSSTSARCDTNVTVDAAMFCRSYPDTAPLWAPYGIKRRNEDIHWESPFGDDDAFEARLYDIWSPDRSVCHRQLDLSFLVEPEPDLWLVSIDANVFEPRNGRRDNTQEDAFEDSTDAGWNGLVHHKPFILDWLADVSRRAKDQGKTLVCFSHYPVLDTYDGTLELEAQFVLRSQAVRRTPHPETARKVASTGIGLHFSGHLHVSDENTLVCGTERLTNVAMPSPVAFPPAFGILEISSEDWSVRHQLLDFERFDAFFPLYDQESGGCDWTQSKTYKEFLYRHVRELVLYRYLPTEWHGDIAALMSSVSVEDLFEIAAIDTPISPQAYVRKSVDANPISGIDLVTDWYAARKASALVRHFVSTERLATYQKLIRLYGARSWEDKDCLQHRLKIFFAMMGRYLGGGISCHEATE
ncbi:metallophosphoesterase family protein [Pelagibacterium lentulum]|uniref:Metallophosphoesterase n=1 Tax=Pelagibacterium lentulum TaxID=2029865 RepID=A0A916RPU0_9HYPH|nr:metallophosphoesterase [Pelagibacterium lentulum]GGA61802.1 metallophosphoesterase [Pelagibacterium lentulum]